MNKNQVEIIDCFTKLIVYTLEFKDNSQNEIYTIEKITLDYETLIDQAKDNFLQKGLRVKFEEALFPCVAWIDEVVLSSKYREKKVWRRDLLQKKFFNTSNAGHEFYERLDALDPKEFELRLLYLYCLFLGFRGKYYRDEDKDTLSAIFEKEQSLLHDDFSDTFPKFAFKDAYAQNISPKKRSFRASYKGLWILISISLVLGVVLFLSQQAHLNGLLDKYNIF